MTDLSADLALADAEARESRERVRFEAFISASDDFTHWQLWCAALAPAVPPGFVLVPVEPTRDQIMAAHDGPLTGGEHEYTITAETEAWLIEMYAAMVSAAPSAKEPTCPKN